MTAAMKIAEFRTIADQACRVLGLWSPAAVQLVVMTACHESHLQYRRQIGGGPALGLCQMETATHDDIYLNFLKYNPEIKSRLLSTLAPGEQPVGETMVSNDLYAAAMCRVHYRRAKAPLPRVDDPDALAQYWKKAYNTDKGAGTPEHFKTSFIALIINETWN